MRRAFELGVASRSKAVNHFPMPDQPPQVLAVVGSLSPSSVTRAVVLHVAERLRADGCCVDVLDFEKEPLPLYHPEKAYQAPGFDALRGRVGSARTFICSAHPTTTAASAA